jgi:hypothetical protein
LVIGSTRSLLRSRVHDSICSRVLFESSLPAPASDSGLFSWPRQTRVRSFASVSEREASGRAVKLRPPSDSDWAAAIYQFTIYRAFENSAVLALAQALPALLEEYAAAICKIADDYDRTLDSPDNIYKYRASDVVAQIEGKGYAADAFWIHVRDGLIQHLIEPVKQSPSALRQRAYALRDASEDAQHVLDQYLNHAKRLRGKRGPVPSIAMFTLFITTDRWKVSILEIARRFDAAGLDDESETDEPDRVRRWVAILTKARKRARELRNLKGTG